MKKRSKKAQRLRHPQRQERIPERLQSTSEGIALAADSAPVTAASNPAAQQLAADIAGLITEQEGNSLSQAKAYWFFGEWQKLAELGRTDFQSHPDKGRMALLVASAHQQLGNHDAARSYGRMALSLGCEPRVVAQVLIAGVHNSLGKIAALRQDQPATDRHFSASIEVGGHRDQALVAHARSVREMTRLGLIKEASSLIDHKLNSTRPADMTAETLQVLAAGQQAIREQLHSANLYAMSAVLSQTSPSADSDIAPLVAQCISASDIHQSVDAVLLTESHDPRTKFDFCCLMAEQQHASGNQLEAISLLNRARLFIEGEATEAEAQYKSLSKRAAEFKQEQLALDFLIQSISVSRAYGADEKQRLTQSYQSLRQERIKRQQHGQDLLIRYIEQQRQMDGQVRPLSLIEIGTTREDIPGQGSTLQLATLCQQKGIEFTTVDMDPHNSAWARHQLQQINPGFQAISMKGEEYLRQHQNPIDYIFLDAYDFDHGKHSELRQSRYEKFLGGRIDEQACHQMHLECAQSLLQKLAPGGVICVDDTWLDDDKNWTAKGTLAVPFLLQNGFEIIEARNRAVLMRRVAS